MDTLSTSMLLVVERHTLRTPALLAKERDTLCTSTLLVGVHLARPLIAAPDPKLGMCFKIKSELWNADISISPTSQLLLSGIGILASESAWFRWSRISPAFLSN